MPAGNSHPVGVTTSEAVWQRINADRSDQAWYYGELLRAFEARLPGSRNLPEFRPVVGELFGASARAA